MTQRWWITLCVFAAVTACSTSIAHAAAPTTPAQITAFATHLKTEGVKWAAGELGDNELGLTARMIKGITYDTMNVSTLTPLIRSVTGRSKPESLYALNRLLRPLVMAKGDVIKKVLPSIKTFHTSAQRYRPIPLRLRKISRMVAPMGKATPDALVAAIAATQANNTNHAQLREIKLWNQELHMFKMTLYELIIFADDSRADRDLLMMLQASLVGKAHAFIDICETVKKHVRTLEKSRAETYHKSFVSFGGQLRAAKDDYVKQYEYKVQKDLLTPVTVSDYPGIRLLTTANLLASVARKSAVVVPTKEQIEAYIKAQKAPPKKRN